MKPFLLMLTVVATLIVLRMPTLVPRPLWWGVPLAIAVLLFGLLRWIGMEIPGAIGCPILLLVPMLARTYRSAFRGGNRD